MLARRACELFHLAFLERLLRASAPGLYVLKGGVNLRFFLGSPRYSEDMGVDVVARKVSVATLKKNGYRLLEDPAFQRSLQTSHVARIEIGDPAKAKHTETTQRFRVGLILDSSVRIPTKIEFSRRGVDERVVEAARIDPEVARRHQRVAFVCDHYVDSEAARQKLTALAQHTTPQARDIFDLDLLSARGVALRPLFDALQESDQKSVLDNLVEIDYDGYRGQVLEYLEEDVRDRLGSREHFERMQANLLESLT